MATYTPAKYQLTKPFTDVTQDPDGRKKLAATFYGGLIKMWGSWNLPDAINQSAITADIIRHVDSGKIGSFRVFIENEIGIHDRKDIINQERCGAVAAEPEVVDEMVIAIDDEKMIGPVFIDNWDALKLEYRMFNSIEQHGSFAKWPRKLRTIRYFENLRVAAQWGEKNRKPTDGIDRIIDVKADATDVEIALAVQKAIINVKKIADKRGDEVGIEGLGSLVVAVLPIEIITAISNTQALSKLSAGDTNQLARGVVGLISGVPVYEALGSEGIGYVTFRGAVLQPIVNPALVTFPTSSDTYKLGLRFATTFVKDGAEGKILPERVIAIGQGITTKVNAPVRPQPERETLANTTADIEAAVDWLQRQEISNKKFYQIAGADGSFTSFDALGICPVRPGSELRDVILARPKIVKVDEEKRTIEVSVDVTKTGGTKKTAKWTIYASDWNGDVVPADGDILPPKDETPTNGEERAPENEDYETEELTEVEE